MVPENLLRRAGDTARALMQEERVGNLMLPLLLPCGLLPGNSSSHEHEIENKIGMRRTEPWREKRELRRNWSTMCERNDLSVHDALAHLGVDLHSASLSQHPETNRRNMITHKFERRRPASLRPLDTVPVGLLALVVVGMALPRPKRSQSPQSMNASKQRDTLLGLGHVVDEGFRRRARAGVGSVSPSENKVRRGLPGCFARIGIGAVGCGAKIERPGS